MVLRNLLSWFVLFFVITESSHGFPKQESLTIRAVSYTHLTLPTIYSV